jgi:NAD(P)-dependent dehydrogenase (short-subunit alcohol dehydrogenase family)
MRTTVITGGGSGIGRAAARLCAAAGHRVAVLDRAVRPDDPWLSIETDVSDEEAVDAAFAEVTARLGVPQGLFAAAGVDLGGPAHELSAERWRTVLDVNLTGAFVASRALLRGVLAGGLPGAIVLCSSPAARVGFAAGGGAAYAASKGGISALVSSLAVDYARHGVRVNAIVPGATETPLMWASVPSAERERMRAVVEHEVPLGRLADPDEPARAAVWLLSDAASYCTGTELVCDGGVLAKASLSV